MSEDLARGEILDAARRVISAVRAACETWRFPSNVNHAAATAGMARSADLLDEAVRLAERPRSIGASILVRAAYESWLVGVWALFGGDDAILGIEKERVRHEKNLVAANDLPDHVLEYVERQRHDIEQLTVDLLGSDSPSSTQYDQMSRALAPLIKEQTRDHEVVDLVDVYNLLYRSHSTNDAHPLKVLGQYLEENALGLRVRPRGPWLDPVISVATMAMFVALLGRWIDQARGRDGGGWELLVSDVRDVLEGSA